MLAHRLQHWLNIKQALCRRHPQSHVLNCICGLDGGQQVNTGYWKWLNGG